MKVPLFKPVVTKEMKDVVINSIDNEFFVLGKSVKEFEDEFARYVGTKYAVSVSSGTNALQFSLQFFNTEGKEVITSPSSFIATSNTIIQNGAKPVFVDIDPETNNINPTLIEEKITDDTVGILPVHLYGYPCEMDKINHIAKNNALFVIEDACQAHGAAFKGNKIGSIGAAGCFSFYSTKNMTVFGDGGIITTDDFQLASLISKLRNCGRVDQNTHDIIGFTSRLNTINAAIGKEQLKYLDKWNKKRNDIARFYDEELDGFKEIVIPPKGKDIFCSYYAYTIRTEKRDELMRYLEKNGISCGIYYPKPIHLQPIYKKIFGYKEGDFPNAESLSKTCLSIPIFPEMRTYEIEYVIKNIKSFFNR